MKTETSLEKALRLATAAHAGHQDRYGQPYILHCLRVMARVEGTPAQTVAILHDVVEDTPWTIEKLRQEGFSEEVLRAIDCLTKREGEDYAAFVERSASDPLARRVKIADLEDNMDVRRMNEVTPEAVERLKKYLTAYRRVTRTTEPTPS